MRAARIGPWAERAWLRATVAMMTTVIGISLWFLYHVDGGDYMTFFALPGYALLASVSVVARLFWQRSISEGRRLAYELTSAAILAVAVLDFFDPTSTKMELDLCGPFILLGLWTVMLDEFMNLVRKHAAAPTRNPDE